MVFSALNQVSHTATDRNFIPFWGPLSAPAPFHSTLSFQKEEIRVRKDKIKMNIWTPFPPCLSLLNVTFFTNICSVLVVTNSRNSGRNPQRRSTTTRISKLRWAKTCPGCSMTSFPGFPFPTTNISYSWFLNSSKVFLTPSCNAIWTHSYKTRDEIKLSWEAML